VAAMVLAVNGIETGTDVTDKASCRRFSLLFTRGRHYSHSPHDLPPRL